jgi:hypothetical protein
LPEIDDEELLRIGSGDYELTLHPPPKLGQALQHRVDVRAGPFSGSITVYCFHSPWNDVYRELSKLRSLLRGTVSLFGYEEMEISFTGDGLGHIKVKAAFQDHPLNLRFEIDLDQTHLPAILAGIDRVFLQDDRRA